MVSYPMKTPKLLAMALSLLAMTASLSGCAWVSADHYYGPAEPKQWNCSHLYHGEDCSYSADNIRVTVDLPDRSGHMTWAGIWPIFLIPVWFLTDTETRDTTGVYISWKLQGASVLDRGHDGMKLQLEDGRTIAPTRITYVEYRKPLQSTVRRELAVDDEGPITFGTDGQSGYFDLSIDYGGSLPDRFTLPLGTVEMDGKKIVIPPLSIETQDGYHYNVSSL